MKKLIFMDTNGWIALSSKRDQLPSKAIDLLRNKTQNYNFLFINQKFNL
jgi:predicted nucleic acid-binding protein